MSASAPSGINPPSGKPALDRENKYMKNTMLALDCFGMLSDEN